MPESRKRTGNHQYHKSSSISGSQRTKGRITCAILFAVFALLIGFFAAGSNYWVLALSAIIGACIGYMIGKRMEKA